MIRVHIHLCQGFVSLSNGPIEVISYFVPSLEFLLPLQPFLDCEQSPSQSVAGHVCFAKCCYRMIPLILWNKVWFQLIVMHSPLWWTFHLLQFRRHKALAQCLAGKNYSSFLVHLRRRDNNGEHQSHDGQKSRFHCNVVMSVAILTNLLWNRDQSLQIHYREYFAESFDRCIQMPKIKILIFFGTDLLVSYLSGHYVLRKRLKKVVPPW